MTAVAKHGSRDRDMSADGKHRPELKVMGPPSYHGVEPVMKLWQELVTGPLVVLQLVMMKKFRKA